MSYRQLVSRFRGSSKEFLRQWVRSLEIPLCPRSSRLFGIPFKTGTISIKTAQLVIKTRFIVVSHAVAGYC